MTKRIIPLAALVLLILFLGASLKPGMAANAPQPLSQETAYPDSGTPLPQPTGYNGPETPNAQPTSYEGPATPSPVLAPTDTLQAGQPTYTPQTTQTTTLTATAAGPSNTPRPSPTKGRNLFATEDAEMQDARVTPPASETPAPSRTVLPSLSPTHSPTPTATLSFNPSWFLAGLLPPTLIVLALAIYYRLKNSGEFHR